jgi:hypothetical protein
MELVDVAVPSLRNFSIITIPSLYCSRPWENRLVPFHNKALSAVIQAVRVLFAITLALTHFFLSLHRLLIARERKQTLGTSFAPR